jgi:hypothetical protein
MNIFRPDMELYGSRKSLVCPKDNQNFDVFQNQRIILLRCIWFSFRSHNTLIRSSTIIPHWCACLALEDNRSLNWPYTIVQAAISRTIMRPSPFSKMDDFWLRKLNGSNCDDLDLEEWTTGGHFGKWTPFWKMDALCMLFFCFPYRKGTTRRRLRLKELLKCYSNSNGND